MRQKLTLIGDQIGLVLDPSYLEKLNLSFGSEVEVALENGRIEIAPSNHRELLEEIGKHADEMLQVHDEVISRLAE